MRLLTVASLIVVFASRGYGEDLKSLLGVYSLQLDPLHEVALFLKIIQEYPDKICGYIKCEEPTSEDDCPDGTQYATGSTQFGCCAACILYQGVGDKCTGSIDDDYGGGYTTFSITSSSAAASKTSKTLVTTDADSNVLRSYWCDYQLECNSTDICEIDSSKQACKFVRMAYISDIASKDYIRYRDEYRWKPDCDEKGYYKPKQCKGSTEEEQICVCVDKDGTSTYGKAYYWQTELYDSMNCLCSRVVSERIAAGEETVTLHCKENGNFDSLQCDLEWCFCVDEETGAVTSETVPQMSISVLPCYNATIQGDIYLRQCDSQYNAEQLLNEALKGHGVYQGITTVINCSPDGSYAGRQCDGADCSCVDKYDSYLVAPSDDDTNCNCIRDQNTFELAGQYYDLECDSATNPGQYTDLQQSGSLVFCVDSDGIRNSPKVREECEDTLSCDMGVDCQNGDTSACEKACDGCPEDAYYYSDIFEDSGDC